MRTSKLTADDIFTAEKAADDRKNTRRSGFAMAEQRDRGWEQLHPYYGTAKDVSIEWGAKLPDDKFMLNIRPYGKDSKTFSIVLDAEEFRKWLRWV